jgi:hypothetical protein
MTTRLASYDRSVPFELVVTGRDLELGRLLGGFGHPRDLESAHLGTIHLLFHSEHGEYATIVLHLQEEHGLLILAVERLQQRGTKKLNSSAATQ